MKTRKGGWHSTIGHPAPLNVYISIQDIFSYILVLCSNFRRRESLKHNLVNVGMEVSVALKLSRVIAGNGGEGRGESFQSTSEIQPDNCELWGFM